LSDKKNNNNALVKMIRLATTGETVANTYAAAVAAYKSAANIPYVGFILGPIAAAAAVAYGLAQVATINGIKFARGGVAAVSKFANGGKAGVTGGALHSQGGTKYYGTDGHVVELERGENWYVLNRQASREINQLSSINKRHGGASFDVGGYRTHFASGGRVDVRTAQVRPVEQMSANTVRDIVKEVTDNLPPIYVVAQDVSNVNAKAESRRQRAQVIPA
jgi:hypothetical protein